MFGMRVKAQNRIATLRKKAKQGNITSLGHAGAAIRLTARRSIRRRKKASLEGTPPNTRRGQLKRAIVYSVEKNRGLVVIGPQKDVVGTAGKAHEFGGRYRREHYPKRPFMGPALAKVKDRLPSRWANSIR
jgi:hypothetical protein